VIVAGAYGASRFSEWVFGGVTRHLLKQRSLCALLMHWHVTGGYMRHQLILAGVMMFITSAAVAESASELRGRVLARENCARCHSIDRYTPSPLKIAPPFRELHRRYPVETLAEALAEGIDTGHPTMPMFRLEPDQINDLLSFLRTLER
jgi:mono/diheme cytochrome c family protein